MKIAFCPKCGGTLERGPVTGDERQRLACAECGYIVYENPRLAVAVLVVEAGRIWLVRRRFPPRGGTWGLPVSLVEVGESAEDVARREVLDTLSIEVGYLRLPRVYSSAGAPVVVITYTADAREDPSPGRRAQEVAAFLPAEIPWADLAFTSTVAALRDWACSSGELVF